jgi:GNAT superfamily N-acetyltransferase
MLSISTVSTAEDLQAAAALCAALGELDATMAVTHGIDPTVIMALYHGQTATSLAEKYSPAGAAILLARWNGAAAGCLAYAPFDDVSGELHKFYVAPEFRKNGIGAALMRMALAAMEEGRQQSRILVHTTSYMADAVSIYQSFDFFPCPPFRDVPDSIRQTELFLSRTT